MLRAGGLWLPSRRGLLAGASSAGLISAARANSLWLATGGPSGTCPKGTAYPDGCPAAPAGVVQYPNLLASYGANRPPWNVAGVDYHVGVPAGTVLTDWQLVTPTSLGNPSGSVSFDADPVSLFNNKIHLGSGSYTFNNIDFSLHGGAWIYTNAATSITVTNSKFGYSGFLVTIASYCIHDQGGASITSINNTFDNFTFSGNAFYGGRGPIVCKYNHWKNSKQHAFEMLRGDAFPGLCTYLIRYNLYDNFNADSGAHANYFQHDGSGTTATNDNLVNIEYNTTYQSIFYNRTATVSFDATGTVTWTGSNLYNGSDQVIFTAGPVPAPLSLNTIYYVVNTTANTFQVANGPQGTPITTAAASGVTAIEGTPGGNGFDLGPNTTTYTWTNPTISNNTVIALLDHGTITKSYQFQGSYVPSGPPFYQVTNGQNYSNYFDLSGVINGLAFKPTTMSSGSGWSSSGNIDMNTGSTITPT
jgi:hypothetical protein